MDKPTKPTNLIPRSFGGVKNNFSSSLQSSGYEDGVPAIYGGDNLNYQLDATGKELDYCEKICDYINAIPINKTPIVDANNKLVYTQYDIRVYSANETYYIGDYVTGVVDSVKHIYQSLKDNNIGQSLSNNTYWKKVDIISDVQTIGRNIGEIVTSTIPLEDAGLHLLDGALIDGNGSYSEFVTYLASLRTDYSNLFATESAWQTAVNTYGVCGKFVYDSVNNTVRLPKVTGKLDGTTDVSVLGDLAPLGIKLPNITGEFYAGDAGNQGTSGAFYNPRNGWGPRGDYDTRPVIAFNASRSSSVYSGNGTDTTIHEQAINVLYYIVIATTTKTDIQVDIDEIATDLNGKADNDLTNVNDSGTSRGAGWAMPSDTYEDLTLGASGTTYTAPANGWVQFTQRMKNGSIIIANDTTRLCGHCSNNTSTMTTMNCYIPVIKNDEFRVFYTGTTEANNDNRFIFIYAKGSESEAN